MTEAFAPEFFLLLGVDTFLGASIVAIFLDKHFPSPLPYVFEVAAFVGFGELVIGPTSLNGFSTTLQFYYSFTFSVIAAAGLLATNLYLLLARGRPIESILVAAAATVPCFLANVYFASAYVNGVAVELPVFPIVPLNMVYVLVLASTGILLAMMVGLKLQTRQTETASDGQLAPASANCVQGRTLPTFWFTEMMSVRKVLGL